MREILFKAKRKDNGEWIEGDYQKRFNIDESEEHLIFQAKNNTVWAYEEIIPETLCQYTGMKDIYGNKIWENDIAKYDDEIVTIEWDDDYKAFVVVSDTVRENLGEFEECDFEILGNMFDNPDMLQINELDYL